MLVSQGSITLNPIAVPFLAMVDRAATDGQASFHATLRSSENSCMSVILKHRAESHLFISGDGRPSRSCGFCWFIFVRQLGLPPTPARCSVRFFAICLLRVSAAVEGASKPASGREQFRPPTHNYKGKSTIWQVIFSVQTASPPQTPVLHVVGRLVAMLASGRSSQASHLRPELRCL